MLNECIFCSRLLETVIESKLRNFQWTVDESFSGKTLVTKTITYGVQE